jgi:hypothetical protein
MKKFSILLIILFTIPTLTYAVFTHDKVINGNQFTASTLKSSLTIISGDNEFNLQPELEYIINAKIINQGTLSSENTQTYKYISDNSDLATKINIKVIISGNVLYDGVLSNYNINKYTLETGVNSDIKYIFSISESDYNSSRGKEVTFRLRNLSTQEGLNYPNGFYNKNSLSFKISIPPLIEPLSEPSENHNNIVEMLLNTPNLLFDSDGEDI